MASPGPESGPGPVTCVEAREALWPPERLRLASSAVLRARVHLKECRDCTEYFSQDAALLVAYDRLRQIRTPRPVRERVFDVLARERTGLPDLSPSPVGSGGSGPSRYWGWWMGAAAAALVVVAVVMGSGGVGGLAPGSSPETSGAIVEDYLRRAVGADHVETTDPLEIQRFLAREIGVPMAGLKHPDLIPFRAEVCLLEGKRGAMIQYRTGVAGVPGGEVISHYVIPLDGATPQGPRIVEMAEDGGPDAMGPAVVTWSRTGGQEALIGNVDAGALLALVEGAGS